MHIAILGLGLIGGSLAYALRGFRAATLIGYDPDASTLSAALTANAIDEAAPSPKEAVANADLIIYASSPGTILYNIKHTLHHLKQGAILTEIGGVKGSVSTFMEQFLPLHTDYVGLHPMAGKEVGGFANADGNLFRGTGMILTPLPRSKPSSRALLEELCVHIGSGHLATNTPAEHDAVIAYTSDLIHIASAALCAHPHPNITAAHTAGAFRDCTRIADIDATLWAELLTQNADAILPMLDAYISALSQVRNTLSSANTVELHALLESWGHNKRTLKSVGIGI